MEVFIKEVLSISDLKKFVMFPHKLYGHNPNWFPELVDDEINTLRSDKNPAFEYCEAKYWLAYQGNEVVGRIAGIISHAYVEKWGNRLARFGWIDFIEDERVAQTLLKTVEAWAVERGMLGVVGPLGFTDFDPEGMLVEGLDRMGSMTTIYNDRYYPIYMERFDYKKDVDWVEFEITIPEHLPVIIGEMASRAQAKLGIQVLQAKNSRELFPYAKGVFELINESYKDLYGVVTLSQKQIDLYIKQYFSFIDPNYVSILLRNNKVVGFAVAMPSLSEALKKARGKLFPFGFIHIYKAMKRNKIADLYLVGVHPDLQNDGASAIIVSDMWQKFRSNGIKKAITHPMLEKNAKVLSIWRRFEKSLFKRRRCYIKWFHER